VPGLPELTTPIPPEGGPPRRRPPVGAIVVAFACVVALVGILVAVVNYSGGRRTVAEDAAPVPSTTAAPPASARDTNDPMAPGQVTRLDPATRSDTEAAVRGNWPLLHNDEFDGTSLDRTFWQPYTGKTTGGVGRHDPDNITVADGLMTITSHGYQSAGMAWMPGQTYGRWEVRVRTHVGTGYGPVILLWPDAEDWPQGGEINFMEIPHGERTESNFIVHYDRDNKQVGTAVPGDFTQWHNYAVEWTPDHIAGFIDGQEIFRTTNKAQIPKRPMHLAIQQDIGPYGKDWIAPLSKASPPSVPLEVDWVRIYGL
jgi:beta-glucanase (GH16 family)